jgi:hypothetical protein
MRPLPALCRSSRHALLAAVVATMTPCAGALLSLAADEAHAQTCGPEDCLPSPGSAYGGKFVMTFPGVGIVANLSDPSLHNFSVCGSPPASVFGAFVDIGFNATMDFGLSINGGPVTATTAPGNGILRATFNHQVGSTRFFDTEMVALDLSGGTLPAGFLLRESPVLASIGPTSIESLGGGQFRVDSFFDVFFELSPDNGVSWIPSTSSGTMTLAGPGCPTPVRHHTWGRLKAIYR